jgi:glutamate-1-semialdehyde aminotransferase
MLAARIARAATQRDRIAICGYHGWTDWYIAANHPDPSPGGARLAADSRYQTVGTGHTTLGVPSQVGVDVKVILMPLSIFCIDNHC